MKTETEYKHTPGPWKASINEYKEHEIKNESGQMFIAQVYLFDADEQTKANANLIAQVPSLLQERDTLKEANKELIELLTGMTDNYETPSKGTAANHWYAKSLAFLKHRKGE